MTASDDAREVIAAAVADLADFTAGGRTIALARADEILAAKMPCGCSVAQRLDHGQRAELMLSGWQQTAVHSWDRADAIEGAAEDVINDAYGGVDGDLYCTVNAALLDALSAALDGAA